MLIQSIPHKSQQKSKKIISLQFWLWINGMKFISFFFILYSSNFIPFYSNGFPFYKLKASKLSLDTTQNTCYLPWVISDHIIVIFLESYGNFKSFYCFSSHISSCSPTRRGRRGTYFSWKIHNIYLFIWPNILLIFILFPNIHSGSLKQKEWALRP